MIVVFDVSNTHIVLGLYQDKELLNHWTVATDLARASDEFAVLLHNLFELNGKSFADVKALVMSSVVPPVMPVLQELSLKYFNLKPIVVGPGVKTGMHVRYDNPREVGADRIVNALAGYERYGGPLIIVDFGTATAFCYVSDKGDYLGGALAPGMEIATEALFHRAAKLPRIEVTEPKSVIGRNTVEAMQSGILYGFASQVDGVVGRFKREIGQPVKVVATGMMAGLVAPHTDSIDLVDPLLTLEGLRIIYERNS